MATTTAKPDLSLRPPVLYEQKSVAAQQKSSDDPVSGTTTNDYVAVYESATTKRAERVGGIFFVVINTDGADSLDYRVLGRLSGSSDFTIIDTTAVAAGANSGILKLSPGLQQFNIQVRSTVADSPATFSIQTSFAPMGV